MSSGTQVRERSAVSLPLAALAQRYTLVDAQVSLASLVLADSSAS
jgi:hypothetical protein